MLRLLNRPPKTLEERYFSEIRPLLYERHATHRQRGIRQERTLAEHLDSACQFVLTVSKLAGVPDDKRAVILAATAVHDLNKLDKSERNVKRYCLLIRKVAFLESRLTGLKHPRPHTAIKGINMSRSLNPGLQN